VRFSNGEAFSADTVVAVFRYLKQSRIETQFASNEARAISDVVKVDDLTIEITTQAPDPILDRRLSLIFMVPEGAWRDLGPDSFSRQPIGTGPFQLTDWGMSKGKYFLDRYKESWRGRGPVARLEMQIVQDSTARVQALVSGRVDLAFGIGLDALDDLRARGLTVLARELRFRISTPRHRLPIRAFGLP
jgi:peptide/nickel transport system substrate-binding protein